MGQVRVDLNISLDGYATTTDQTPENPIGKDWMRLVAAYAATRTFRERVVGQSGKGTKEVAGDLDVRIGGGASVVREYLAAGVVDRLHVGIGPILLGRGERLWEDLRELEPPLRSPALGGASSSRVAAG